jgi:hypothetical protein
MWLVISRPTPGAFIVLIKPQVQAPRSKLQSQLQDPDREVESTTMERGMWLFVSRPTHGVFIVLT